MSSWIKANSEEGKKVIDQMLDNSRWMTIAEAAKFLRMEVSGVYQEGEKKIGPFTLRKIKTRTGERDAKCLRREDVEAFQKLAEEEESKIGGGELMLNSTEAAEYLGVSAQQASEVINQSGLRVRGLRGLLIKASLLSKAKVTFRKDMVKPVEKKELPKAKVPEGFEFGQKIVGPLSEAEAVKKAEATTVAIEAVRQKPATETAMVSFSVNELASLIGSLGAKIISGKITIELNIEGKN
jgi:hypothetical protein